MAPPERTGPPKNPQQLPYQPYQHPQQQHGYPGQPSGNYPQPPSGGYQQPPTQAWPPPIPGSVNQRRRKWPWVFGGLVVLLLILIFSAAGTSKSGGTTAPPLSSGSVNAAQPAVPATPPKAITARDWAKIAKDPDSHVGEAIIVYGEVTQFDSATGTNTFRADVDGVKHPVSYGFADYPTNTVLSGNAPGMSDLVQGDLFQAEATVAGSLSYQNTMGGSLSAPQLTVLKVTVIGSTK